MDMLREVKHERQGLDRYFRAEPLSMLYTVADGFLGFR